MNIIIAKGGPTLFNALDFSDPKNINSFLSSLVLPVMETYKYRREVKAFLRHTLYKTKRLRLKIKLKGTNFK
jgi:hypothetical protein